MRTRPTLILFTSATDEHSGRAEDLLGQVLQPGDAETFTVRRVALEEHPDLHERFNVQQTPTFIVVEDKRVRGRLADPARPEEIKAFLARWLR